MASHDDFNFPTVNWFMQQSSAIVFQHKSVDDGRTATTEEPPVPSSKAEEEYKRKALRAGEGYLVKGKRRLQGMGKSKRAQPVQTVPRRKYRKVTRAQGVEPHLNPAVVAYLQEWKSGQHEQRVVDTSLQKLLKAGSIEQSRIQSPEEQLGVGWNVPGSPIVPDLEGINCGGSARGSSTDGELLPNIDLLLNSPLNTKTHPWQEKPTFEDNCDELEYDLSFNFCHYDHGGI